MCRGFGESSLGLISLLALPNLINTRIELAAKSIFHIGQLLKILIKVGEVIFLNLQRVWEIEVEG